MRVELKQRFRLVKSLNDIGIIAKVGKRVSFEMKNIGKHYN